MKKTSIFLALLMAFSVASCSPKGESSSGNGSNIEGTHSKGLPDYDAVKADEMVFMGWYSPTISRENFETYKACGFNYIFLQGNVGPVGGSAVIEALELCEELDIKAFVDISQAEDLLLSSAERFSKYNSFVGFNYDEPVIYTNTLNDRLGIVELSAYVKAMHKQQPKAEFLVNLNPTNAVGYPWGTPPFTYAEYLQAQQTYINSIYAGSDCDNWISCDDYPLCRNTSAKTEYYLKTTWLQNLEYLANVKRDSEIPLTSNFFIQTMPLGTDKDRIPTYNDLRLQLYTLMAYGYDSASFFCYATPPQTGEFNREQAALIDRNGNKTSIYTDSQKVIGEITKFSNTYMQFNDNWLGIFPILGSNNTAKDDMYYNNSFDCLMQPIKTEKALKGVKALTATEDTIVGYMQDNVGNPGYMAVNYNDTTYGKKSDVTFTFNKYNKAYVYIDGVKEDVVLKNNQLTLHLDIGEGVFVIPYVG